MSKQMRKIYYNLTALKIQILVQSNQYANWLIVLMQMNQKYFLSCLLLQE